MVQAEAHETEDDVLLEMVGLLLPNGETAVAHLEDVEFVTDSDPVWLALLEADTAPEGEEDDDGAEWASEDIDEAWAEQRLTDRDLSLAAGMNHPRLPVHRRPRVAVLATGDELVLPGADPKPGQIVLSNGYALHALARQEGADTIDLGIAADTMEATTAAIRRARDSGADLLVTTGGASVGDHDLMHVALQAEGVDLAFWKIALRPGKPMMHGRLGSMRVIGLPGNPVSSYICAFLFMVPLLRALSGRDDVHHAREPAVLGNTLAANDQRQDYLRASLARRDDGATVATTVSHQDSSLLANLAAAQALIVRLPFAPAAAAGEACSLIRLPD